MAGRRLFSKALAFDAPSSPLLRHHSAAAAAAAAAAAGTLETNSTKPAVPISQSDSVLSLLQSRGVAAGDIAGFASRGMLDVKLGRNFGSKFDLLLSLGFSASDVAKLMQNSSLMSWVSLSALTKRIEFFKSVVDDDNALMTMIKRATWNISSAAAIEKRVADNIAILKDLGVPEKKIKSFLVLFPRFFQRKSESIVAAANRSQTEFGVAHNDKMFLYHVLALSAQPDSTRQAKVRMFESFGWQSSDVHTLAKTNPMCFILSATKLEKGVEFLMNTAGFSPSYIASHPLMLQVSLEGRVSPRYYLIQALKSKCLVPDKLRFYSAVILIEKEFRIKFVDKFIGLEPDACKAYISTVTLAQKK